LRILEEAVELPAGGVKGALLLFRGAMVDERSTFVVKHGEEQLLEGTFAQSRILLQVSDELAAEGPEIIPVLVQGLARETEAEQVQQEGFEDLHDTLSRSEVALLEAPTPRPVLQVRAILFEALEIRCHNDGLAHCLGLATDAADPLAQCLPPLSRLCL